MLKSWRNLSQKYTLHAGGMISNKTNQTKTNKQTKKKQKTTQKQKQKRKQKKKEKEKITPPKNLKDKTYNKQTKKKKHAPPPPPPHTPNWLKNKLVRLE